MKTLFLMRHAKSSWKDEGLADFERPLNSRGKRAAEMMGNLFKKKKIIPDLVLCSCAVRARQTVDILLRTAKLRPELRFDERIYEASVARLMDVITQVEKPVRSVLVVGHNPGMEELIPSFTGLTGTMPTAALAKITFKTSNWSNTETKAGTLEWIVRPKELEKVF